jgi:membrane associated rhomboid family serine protease
MLKVKEKYYLLKLLFFPFVLTALLFAVKIIEEYNNVRFIELGVYPKSLKGLLGIITHPFVHGDWLHLLNNSVSLFFLSLAIIYFYKKIARQIIPLLWLVTGFWLWIFGRESYHIGASTLVYAFASFLFFSGVFRRNKSLAIVSMLVVFLYGSMVWGIFPMKVQISFEGHLSGFLAGIVFAYYFRKQGPDDDKYSILEEEAEDGTDDENAYWKLPEEDKNSNIHYHYKAADKSEE